MKTVLAALRWLWIVAVLLGCVWLWPKAVDSGHEILPAMVAAIALLTIFCFYRANRPWQLLYPALLALTLSVAVPIAYTFVLAFQHIPEHGSRSMEESRRALLALRRPTGITFDVDTVVHDGQIVLLLSEAPANNQESIERLNERLAKQAPILFHTRPFRLETDDEASLRRLFSASTVPLTQILIPGPWTGASQSPKERDFLKDREEQLRDLRLILPGRSSALGWVEKGVWKPQVGEWTPVYGSAKPGQFPPEALIELSSGERVLPDRERGFFYKVDNQGRWLGPALGMQFNVAAGFDNYRTLLQLWKPLGRQGLWSLGYALASLAVAVPFALYTVWCLHRRRHPLLWLAALILPAAIPATIALLILKLPVVIFRAYSLWNQDPVLGITMVLLLGSFWLLVPLLTLWFHHLLQAEAESPKRFIARWWFEARAPLLLLFGVLFMAYTPIEFLSQGGLSSMEEAISWVRVPTATLASLTLSTSPIFPIGASAALGTLLLFVAAILGVWRLYLLQRSENPRIRVSSTVEYSGKPHHFLQRTYLLLMIALGAIPLLFLVLVSMNIVGWDFNCPGSVFNLYGAFTCSFHERTPSLDYWRQVMGETLFIRSGQRWRPPFPWLLWIANSWKMGLINTFTCLALAASAAWALYRYTFTERKWLENGGLVIQFFVPSTLMVAVLFLPNLLEEQVPLLRHAPHLMLWLFSGGACFLAMFPLLAALRRLPEGAYGLHGFVRTMWRPALAVALLILTQQLGEYIFAGLITIKVDSLSAAVGVIRTFNPNDIQLNNFAAAAILFSAPIALLFLLLIPLGNRDLVRHWRP